MEQKNGVEKQRFWKGGGGGKLDKGVGALKKGGWNPLTYYAMLVGVQGRGVKSLKRFGLFASGR